MQKALSGRRLLKISSDRNVTRVLFVSRNTDLLSPTEQSLDGYLDVSGLFAEVHILILREGIVPKKPVLRAAPNVWIYTAASSVWWKTPLAGIELMQNQLEFAAGFRPDLIVALDPFESAVTAYRLGKVYQKPMQLHILENYLAPDFNKKADGNWIRRFLARYTVARFLSIRTRTDAMESRLKDRFTVPDLATLPRFQDYQAMIESDVEMDLKASGVVSF